MGFLLNGADGAKEARPETGPKTAPRPTLSSRPLWAVFGFALAPHLPEPPVVLWVIKPGVTAAVVQIVLHGPLPQSPARILECRRGKGDVNFGVCAIEGVSPPAFGVMH